MLDECRYDPPPTSHQPIKRIPPRRRNRLRQCTDDQSAISGYTHSTCSSSQSGASTYSSMSRQSRGSVTSRSSTSSRQSHQSRKSITQTLTIRQELVTTRGTDCVCHVWYPPANVRPRGVVVIFHGLNAHGRFPTIAHLARLVASRNHCIAYCLDFPGHGLSPGLRGHVTSAEDMVADGMAVTLYAKKRNAHLPLFLAGQSLGGGVASLVAREFYVAGNDPARFNKEEKSTYFEKARSLMILNCSSRKHTTTSSSPQIPNHIVAGLMLLAPMVSIAVPKWQKGVLKSIASVAPRAALFPPAENASEAQFNDPVIRKQIENDDLSYRGNLRASSALACLKLTKRVGAAIQEMTKSTQRENLGQNMPLLCVIGKNDQVVDNEALVSLLVPDVPEGEDMEPHAPIDVALREYEALHGLLCELEPVRGWIESDIVTWLNYRVLPPGGMEQVPTTLQVDRSKLGRLPGVEEKENRQGVLDHAMAVRERLESRQSRECFPMQKKHSRPPLTKTRSDPMMDAPSSPQQHPSQRPRNLRQASFSSPRPSYSAPSTPGTCDLSPVEDDHFASREEEYMEEASNPCAPSRSMGMKRRSKSLRSVSNGGPPSFVMEVGVEDFM